MTLPRILHVGCGNEPLPAWFPPSEEVRLDIDPNCNPDIVASITDLGDIGPFDGLFCCHCLEHVYPHEVAVVLSEFRRVLIPGGYAAVLVPDLQDVRATEDVLYESAAGPITGLDMIYGHRKSIPTMPYMAHHTGFTRDTLDEAMVEAGFASTVKRVTAFNLLAIGIR